MQRALPQPIPLEEAQRSLLALAPPPSWERIPIGEAVGRYLAKPVFAGRTQPSADLSAMDGYAMRPEDKAGPWRIIGESAAGHPYSGALRSGEAVRISTGAHMPDDAGAVLLQEEAVREGDQLSLAPGGEPTPRHIRRKGFDFSSGDAILSAGVRIGPAQLALAITAGIAELEVGKRPTLAIIDSGDELTADPTACAPHQIPASNGAMLAAMATPWVESWQRIGPVADDLSALRNALHIAEADVIVTSGGASVGDHDLIRPALEEWGASIEFWRVLLKPGKPLLVARRGQQIVLGLPGNPVSSYVTGYLFLLPLLRSMAGAGTPMPVALEAALTKPAAPTGNRLEFIRGYRDGANVTPLDQQDSSALAALAASNALIRREIDAPAASAGDRVTVYPLENGGIA